MLAAVAREGPPFVTTTIYSLATQLGVSASTVSRAFTRPEMVRPEVRRQILSAASDAGYHPHLSARRLATGRNNMVGVMMPDITNPFFPPLLRALQTASATYHRELLFIDSGESTGNESKLVAQLRNQVDGLIVVSPRSRPGALLQAVQTLPLVTVNRVFKSVPAVVCSDEEAIDSMTRYLRTSGHEQLALMSGPANSWTSRRRAQAVKSAAQGSGLMLAELGHFPATFAGGLTAATALVRTAATAVFAFDDVTACGLIAGLAQAGLRVPDDMSVIGCDDVPLASMTTPSLTTLAAPFEGLARAAVEVVMSLMSDGVSDTATRELPSALVTRGSTGPAPQPQMRTRP